MWQGTVSSPAKQTIVHVDANHRPSSKKTHKPLAYILKGTEPRTSWRSSPLDSSIVPGGLQNNFVSINQLISRNMFSLKYTKFCMTMEIATVCELRILKCSLTRGAFLGGSSSESSSSLLIILWMEAISVFLPLFAVEPRPLPLPLGAALLRPTCCALSSSCEH